MPGRSPGFRPRPVLEPEWFYREWSISNMHQPVEVFRDWWLSFIEGGVVPAFLDWHVAFRQESWQSFAQGDQTAGKN